MNVMTLVVAKRVAHPKKRLLRRIDRMEFENVILNKVENHSALTAPQPAELLTNPFFVMAVCWLANQSWDGEMELEMPMQLQHETLILVDV